MFVAVDENNNKVSIENADKSVKYFCPSCGAPAIIKAANSLAVKVHFAHKKGSDCDSFSHDMSEWHLGWQRKFPIENREVTMEKDGIKHRADVFINDTVIEFQHSPISADEIAKRNDFYLSLGYRVIWIFDATDQVTNYLGDSIDPLDCRYGGLCWKRAKRQFLTKMPQNVYVFLQYKTTISDPLFKDQTVDVLVWWPSVETKYINFLNTQISDYKFEYLLPDSFLKSFELNENPKSVSMWIILNAAIDYQNNLKRRMRMNNRTVMYYPRYKKSKRL